jgi:hypothetical protein
LEQTGCGIGRIDSNGGDDYTVEELGDTSDASETCDLAQECIEFQDSSVRVDVTVGDGVADICSAGSANYIVSVPVLTTTWVEHSSGDTCPPKDGTFNPDQGDQFIVQFPQILDFTTDTNATRWVDLDGDDCSIAGTGPPIGFSNTGTCLDLEAGTLTTVASGAVGSSAALRDLSYTAVLPSAFSGPEPPLGATCATPPLIDFNGRVHRCVEAE